MPKETYQVTHEFLYLPDCPVSLLGRDLLPKLQAQITFTPRDEASLPIGRPTAKVLALTAPESEEWWLFVPQEPVRPLELPFPDVPGVWVEKIPQDLLNMFPL
jgi:hypothetical protein